MKDNSGISDFSDQHLLAEIGNFIQQKRIKQEITQQDLAGKAAISRSTLSLIERGENISLINLLKILRILDSLHVFSAFQLPTEISPLQLAKRDKVKRQRASVRNQIKEEDLGW